MCQLVHLVNRGTHCRAYYTDSAAGLIISLRDAVSLSQKYNVPIQRAGYNSIEQERLCDTWTDPMCYPQLDPNKDLSIDRTTFAREVRNHILFCLKDTDAEDPNVFTVY